MKTRYGIVAIHFFGNRTSNLILLVVLLVVLVEITASGGSGGYTFSITVLERLQILQQHRGTE